MLRSWLYSCLLPAVLCAGFVVSLRAQSGAVNLETAERTQRHQTEEWRQIEPYLPNLSTASAAQLQQQGDILRARRFEEDALDYYTAALKQGGDEATLLNRIGVTHLVLRHPELARACFHRVLTLRPKDAQAWNNLGATEYFAGNHRAALTNYLRAVKLDRSSALFHSNLATTYFELKDYDSAAKQFQAAFRLDPHVFEHVSSGGMEAHMLTATERGRFCFELARVAATQHRDEAVLEWLRKALDANFDIREEMPQYAVLSPYQHDPRVALLITNAHALHGGRLAANTAVPTLAEIGTPE